MMASDDASPYEADVCQLLDSPPGTHVNVEVASPDEIDPCMSALVERIREKVPDVLLEEFGSICPPEGSLHVRRAEWEADDPDSVLWVRPPPNFKIGENGLPYTQVSFPAFSGAVQAEAVQAHKTQYSAFMSMLGVPAGFVLSGCKLVKKDAPENESSQ